MKLLAYFGILNAKTEKAYLVDDVWVPKSTIKVLARVVKVESKNEFGEQAELERHYTSKASTLATTAYVGDSVLVFFKYARELVSTGGFVKSNNGDYQITTESNRKFEHSNEKGWVAA